ncbi:MAG: M1 family aminopeptidase [Candidatus Ozemobacteraceae bacterium]
MNLRTGGNDPLRVLLSLLFLLLVFIPEVRGEGFSLESFSCHIELNPEEGHLRGLADLTVTFPKLPSCSPMLGLREGLQPTIAWEFLGGKWVSLPCKKDRKILVVFPTLQSGTHRLKIQFEGDLPRAGVDKASTTTGEKLDGTTKSAMSPTFGQLLSTECWHPWIPALGTPRPVNGAILSVSIPDTYQVVAPGKKLKDVLNLGVRTTTWQIGSGARLGGFSLFYSNHHTLVSQTVQGRVLGVFLPTTRAELAPLLISALDSIIRHHSSCLKIPYPYQHQTIVFSDLFPSRWGYGKYAETLLVASDYLEVMASRSPAERQLKALSFIGHELGHHWFGILIGLDEYMAFEEGMAELLASLATTKLFGETGRTAWRQEAMRNLKTFFSKGGQDFPLKDDVAKYLVNPTLDPNIFRYAKDLELTKFPLYMWKARAILGDKDFYLTIQAFSRGFVGGKIRSWEDFLAALPASVNKEKRELIQELFLIKHASLEDLVAFLGN